MELMQQVEQGHQEYEDFLNAEVARLIERDPELTEEHAWVLVLGPTRDEAQGGQAEAFQRIPPLAEAAPAILNSWPLPARETPL